jgi:Rhodopirellula transposase DDE domain
LILSDCGGGNSARSRVWKKDIQNKVSSKYGLAVTMCHFPPGASKWNPIEHRLFSEISKNWSGVPLDSYETAINYIRTTKTTTGLTVKVRVSKRTYETGEKVSNFEMASLNIRHRKNCQSGTTRLCQIPKIVQSQM